MRRNMLIAAGTVLALTLAACGGDTKEADSTDKAATDVLATDISHIKEDADIAALVPESVKKDGKLTIGDNIYYAPAEFYAADGKTAQGYDIDMAKALAKVMGLEADIQQSEFAAIIPAIGSKYEVGIANFSITAERQKTVNMIQYFEVGSSWSVGEDNPKDFDPASPCGFTIGVQTGTVQDEAIEAINATCDEKIEIQRYKEQSAVTTALAGGKLDAMYTDSSVADYAARITDGSTEKVGTTEDVAGVGIVVSKEDAALTEAIQKALQKLIDDGDLKKIFDTWGIAEGVASEALLNPAK